MAGFRRLCGRFRVRRQNEPERGREREIQAFTAFVGALCRWVGRVGERRELRAHAHEWSGGRRRR